MQKKTRPSFTELKNFVAKLKETKRFLEEEMIKNRFTKTRTNFNK